MRSFNYYYGEKVIIQYLCKQRAKLAQNRNSQHVLHKLSKSQRFNHHQSAKSTVTKTFQELLNSLLPSRRNWVSNGKEYRYINKTSRTKVSSYMKNVLSLKKTIARDRKINPQLPYLANLDSFITDTISKISSKTYTIGNPTIYPKEKDKNALISKCRPISLYELQDRMVLSFANSFLTDLFDADFLDCSFAFRSKEKNISTPTHHDCISKIQEYIKTQKRDIWVFECDMEKFYDSVSHTIIRKLFRKLKSSVQKRYPAIATCQVTAIFESYLKSYSFNKSVLPLNTNEEYWTSYKIEGGQFPWVADGLRKYYNNVNYHKIGVPQGGPLSGLISNIVLHEADKAMQSHNVNYMRFCDDMIVLSTNFKKCRKAKSTYLQSLQKLKLSPHPFDARYVYKKTNSTLPIPIDLKSFWKCKSKGPYRWSNSDSTGLIWIGFVGYELTLQGQTRVRKRSLLKELTKQKQICDNYLKALINEPRKSKNRFFHSLSRRLIGMSVGMVEIHNYKTLRNEICWASGFKKLNNNKHSRKQLKELDRNRNRLLTKFYTESRKLKHVSGVKTPKAKQIIKYDKPYSYFYQLLKQEHVSFSPT